MSVFSREQVRKIAHLSRLEFSNDEADAFAGQLGRILDYVEKLNELDTEGVAPSPHALAQTNVLRDDEPRPSLDNVQALANAPDQEAGCFRVPPIIQEQ